MLASWRRTNIQDSVAVRLSNTFADAAVSITITSITDCISFYIGAITPFPCVQVFCIYTGETRKGGICCFKCVLMKLIISIC